MQNHPILAVGAERSVALSRGYYHREKKARTAGTQLWGQATVPLGTDHHCHAPGHYTAAQRRGHEKSPRQGENTVRELQGRTAIVTGASRGIGPYVARALARRRMNVVLAARSTADLEATAVSVRALGAEAAVVTCDVALAGEREKLIEAALAAFGAVDVLVNNAGIETIGAYEREPLEEIERVIAVNLAAPMLLSRLVLPGMVERGSGHIVNMASLAGKAGTPYSGPYSATKGALILFTESLRHEFRKHGVSASAVCPGFVSDAGMYEDMARSSGVRASKLLGTSTPAQVAAAVVRCIEHDRPEAIVNPGPMRPLFAIGELMPGLFERVLPLFGANAMFETLARQRER